MKLKINAKLLLFSLFIVLVPSLVIGFIGYRAIGDAYFMSFKLSVNDRLMADANSWHKIVDSTYEHIEDQEEYQRNLAEGVVTSQTKSVYDLIAHEIARDNGKPTPEQSKDLLDRLSQEKVGKTGYIYIMDYQGKYILSKDRARDGENIWESKDADGNLIIQKIIATAKELRGRETSLLSYPWLNAGETVPREKIVGLLNFPEMGWVVGVSTYFDDVAEANYRAKELESLKEIIKNQRIGKTGYIWVVDSKGNYVVSKDRARDGENIWESKDANGVLFIQEAIAKAKNDIAKDKVEVYPWKNKDETKAREKVAGLSYFKEFDWIIGASAYYDDFEMVDFSSVRNQMMIVIILSILIALLIAYFIASRISKPLKVMAAAGQKIASGDLNANIPVIKSGDEVEDVYSTMSMMVGAIKYLKENQKK